MKRYMIGILAALAAAAIFAGCAQSQEPTQPTETEVVEATQSVETEPAETQPVETEPAETEPVETEPAETEPTAPLPRTPDNLLPGESSVYEWRTNEFVGYYVEKEHLLYHPDGTVWMDYKGLRNPDAIDHYITFSKGDMGMVVYDGDTLEQKLVLEYSGYLRPAGEDRYCATILDEYPWHVIVYDKDLNELHTFQHASGVYLESDDNGVRYSLYRFEDQSEYEYYDYDTFELLYTEPMERETFGR